MYARLWYGFYVVQLKDAGQKIGICGLVKRDFLDDVDIGYAFLPQYHGKAYAYESASAVLEYAKCELGLQRVVAAVRSDNYVSAGLLKKLGLRFERMVKHPDEAQELELFAINIQ
jgi:RimJ/RimL family protein N-acetyltransferase